MKITATGLDFKALNEQIKAAQAEEIFIEDCCGQRFIGSGLEGPVKTININGTPGNALGSYLNGTVIKVEGNVQDAVGDTMNDGEIIVNGNAGDALGYAMRGGTIYVKGHAGYRTGIHMKEYREKKPAIVVGGSVGSFLGEYLAGGLIVVLGFDCPAGEVPIGDFAGTGMHGGRIFVKSQTEVKSSFSQVLVRKASDEDLLEIMPYLENFSKIFDINIEKLAKDSYYILEPNGKNPYKRLYTTN